MGTTTITGAARRLKALLPQIEGLLNRKPAAPYEVFFFSGNGTQTDFELESGWRVLDVTVLGTPGPLRPGEAYDLYSVGGEAKRGVRMQDAPGSVSVAIRAWRAV